MEEANRMTDDTRDRDREQFECFYNMQKLIKMIIVKRILNAYDIPRLALNLMEYNFENFVFALKLFSFL